MSAMHLAYRIAQKVRLVYWRIVKPRTHGVKIIAMRDDRHVLLVRHSYQSRDLFMLPGGGIHRGETVMAAAVRELREEAGCVLGAPCIHGEFFSSAEGARNHITVVTGSASGYPKADGREILEAAFVPLDALPGNIAPATLRRLIEVRDHLPPADSW
ncbi:NUDIX domain-containing protein [Blastomonas aquatica]|uniref:NUDIX hydrolase n=1 Tax=Blastomonas aquatica TaxID=1510276 RepID=A0ABQ1JHG0_9SPHN|nr:NUDIX domain-containing protein [Blastomonas aquatica]GGB68630.1 NUDIX hydrolase [Blastomonas aquatica]